MEFSSLVLMEIDKESKSFVKEMGSYEIERGGEYIERFFYDGEVVSLYFGVGRDVEDWEFDALYDYMPEEDFVSDGFCIEEVEEQYNPTWCVKLKYEEEHSVMEDKIKKLCNLIEKAVQDTCNVILDKKQEYIQ